MKKIILFAHFFYVFTLWCMQQPQTLDALLTQIENAKPPRLIRYNPNTDIQRVSSFLQEQQNITTASNPQLMGPALERLAEKTNKSKIELAFRLGTFGTLTWLQEYRENNYKAYIADVCAEDFAWLQSITDSPLFYSAQAYWLAKLVEADSSQDVDTSYTKYQDIALPQTDYQWPWAHAAAAAIAGRHLYNKVNPELATSYLYSAAQQTANGRARATGCYYLGHYHLKKKEYGYAEWYFQLTQQQEDSPRLRYDAYVGLGQLYIEQKKFAEAEKQLNTAINQTESKDIQALGLLWRGIMHQTNYNFETAQQQLDKAEKDFEAVIALQSHLWAMYFAHYYLGIIHFEGKSITNPSFKKAFMHLINAENNPIAEKYSHRQPELDYMLGVLNYWGWGLEAPNLQEAHRRFEKVKAQQHLPHLVEQAEGYLNIEWLKKLKKS